MSRHRTPGTFRLTFSHFKSSGAGVFIERSDPQHIDSVFKLNVEGVLAIDGTPTTSPYWIEGMVTVAVSDGRLTVGNATGAANNKICFIEIDRP